MQQFVHLTPPTEGAAITRRGGELVVPDVPIVPFIEGDGTGPDIWRASVRVFDAAVAKAYGVSAPLVGTRRAVIVVDEEGVIRHHHAHRLGLDFQTVDEIRAVLDELPQPAGSTD